jgi:hypothetical protein
MNYYQTIKIYREKNQKKLDTHQIKSISLKNHNIKKKIPINDCFRLNYVHCIF